jgi:hypothetical protein
VRFLAMGYLVWRRPPGAYPLRILRTRLQSQRKAAADNAARKDRSERNPMTREIVGALAWCAGAMILAALVAVPTAIAVTVWRHLSRRH